MRYLRCTALLLVVLSIMFLGACTKKSAPDASSSTTTTDTASAPASTSSGEKTDEGLPHPCTLVTEQDAIAIMGPGAKVVRNSVSECDLEAKNIFDGGSMSIKIEPAGDDWKGGKEMTMKFDKESKSVSGIGDDAYTFMGGLVILKGKMEINVIATAYKSKVMPKEQAVEYVAKKVIGRV